MSDPFSQHGYRVRLGWGPAAAALLAGSCELVVIVDVLSFTTTVDIAVSRGASVIPLRWGRTAPGRAGPPEAGRREAGPAEIELPEGAVLAGGRSLSSWSLSPSSLVDAPAGLRLALPSPNGATLSAAAAAAGATVLAASLRNAPAVASAASCGDGVIGVVPAGERWPDGSLRPALEDLLGAGAVVAELARRGGPCSPEALAAADAFEAAHRRGLGDSITACESGRELLGRGFGGDVALAAEYGVSRTVPLLRNGEFGPAGADALTGGVPAAVDGPDDRRADDGQHGGPGGEPGR